MVYGNITSRRPKKYICFCVLIIRNMRLPNRCHKHYFITTELVKRICTETIKIVVLGNRTGTLCYIQIFVTLRSTSALKIKLKIRTCNSIVHVHCTRTCTCRFIMHYCIKRKLDSSRDPKERLNR